MALEDLQLAGGDPAQDGGALVGRTGHGTVEQPAGNRRGQPGVPARHRAGRRDQLLGWRALEQEATGPGRRLRLHSYPSGQTEPTRAEPYLAALRLPILVVSGAAEPGGDIDRH